MADQSSQLLSLQSRALEGIGCVLLGMAFFVAQDGLMKSLLLLYPIWMLIFVRGVVTVLVLMPAILYLGRPHRLLSPLWPLHLARAALFASGFTLFYAAFPFMGLAEVSTIFFSAPLMIALLASFWLGEKIGPHRIAALVVGFAGVIIAMNPGGETFQWVAVLPLVCAATYAVSQILARKIGDRDTTLTTALYTVVLAGILIVPAGWIVNQLVPFGPEFSHLQWNWPAVSFSDGLWLALLGSVGLIGFALLSRAYQITSASLVAPFDYAYLPMATIMAYLIWDEVPGVNTLVGMVLIIASGLYLGYRELKSSRRSRIEPRPVAESVVAPGNPTAPMSLGPDVPDR